MVTALILSNPLGAQCLLDGAVPRTLSAIALETISGGQWVTFSGTALVVSGVESFQSADLTAIAAIDNTLCNGLAINNAGSNEWVTVATRGAYLCAAGEIVSGGAQVTHTMSGTVQNILNTGSVPTTTMGPTPIGRALTTSASGTALYALINLNL